jgi:DNA ligase-1
MVYSKIFSVLAWLFLSDLVCSQSLPLMQAKKYTEQVVVNDYFVSEKLDGVRARWNGTALISRGGKVLAAPSWFTQSFPPQVLDGELWLGRGKYQQTVSIVTQHKPHPAWGQLKFMVFDLPSSNLPFAGRVKQMQIISAQSQSRFLQVIPQLKLDDSQQLMALLDQVVNSGGEGLMLLHGAALYVNGRSSQLLKLKEFSDGEAVVIAYKAGRGKFSGLVGSLKLRSDDGREFYVGSGLSDKLRASPPAIGSIITYRYQGFTDSGLPRFPVYIRQRFIQ